MTNEFVLSSHQGWVQLIIKNKVSGDIILICNADPSNPLHEILMGNNSKKTIRIFPLEVGINRFYPKLRQLEASVRPKLIGLIDKYDIDLSGYSEFCIKDLHVYSAYLRVLNVIKGQKIDGTMHGLNITEGLSSFVIHGYVEDGYLHRIACTKQDVLSGKVSPSDATGQFILYTLPTPIKIDKDKKKDQDFFIFDPTEHSVTPQKVEPPVDCSSRWARMQPVVKAQYGLEFEASEAVLLDKFCRSSAKQEILAWAKACYGGASALPVEIQAHILFFLGYPHFFPSEALNMLGKIFDMIERESPTKVKPLRKPSIPVPRIVPSQLAKQDITIRLSSFINELLEQYDMEKTSLTPAQRDYCINLMAQPHFSDPEKWDIESIEAKVRDAILTYIKDNSLCSGREIVCSIEEAFSCPSSILIDHQSVFWSQPNQLQGANLLKERQGLNLRD